VGSQRYHALYSATLISRPKTKFRRVWESAPARSAFNRWLRSELQVCARCFHTVGFKILKKVGCRLSSVTLDCLSGTTTKVDLQYLASTPDDQDLSNVGHVPPIIVGVSWHVIAPPKRGRVVPLAVASSSPWCIEIWNERSCDESQRKPKQAE
jgi:hypothetical protein